MEALMIKAWPVIDKFVSPFCPCIESPEAKLRRERRSVLVQGAKFTRRKTTFGLDLGQVETVSLQLLEDDDDLKWFVVPAGKGENSGSISMRDIASVGAKAPCSITVMATSGETLLEVEAEESATRDLWVQALNEAIPERSSGADITLRPSTISGRAAKQAHFLQRGVELQNKAKDAAAKKEKYLKGAGGLKYTALAMAERG
jgi:hypothetical protein